MAGCPVIAQTVYLNRHNAITSAIHWSLCGACGFEQSEEWWKHNPEPVLENANYKVLYDFNIFTDRLISARRPDLVLVSKETNNTFLIDVACVMDRNVLKKEKEKVEKYVDLTIELQRVWGTTIKMIPLIFGALGTISNNLSSHMASLPIKDLNVRQLQKTVILRTATIIRQHLSLPGSS